MFEEYIGPNETVLFSFKISLQWIIVNALLSGIIFGGLAFIFWNVTLLAGIFLTILGLIFLLLLVNYVSIDYFITQQKIYKKTGLIATTVAAAKRDEVTDMVIERGIFQTLLYNNGTIKINTSGSIRFEIIMRLVGAPFETKQRIYELWDANPITP